MPHLRLGFGMMRLPLTDDHLEHVDFEKTCEMVDAFIERGGTYFDSSFVYHNGKSEEFTRRSVVERYPRDRLPSPRSCPHGPSHPEKTCGSGLNSSCKTAG